MIGVGIVSLGLQVGVVSASRLVILEFKSLAQQAPPSIASGRPGSGGRTGGPVLQRPAWPRLVLAARQSRCPSDGYAEMALYLQSPRRHEVVVQNACLRGGLELGPKCPRVCRPSDLWKRSFGADSQACQDPHGEGGVQTRCIRAGHSPGRGGRVPLYSLTSSE